MSNTHSSQLLVKVLVNHLDRSSLVRLSGVSRMWNAAANNVLWRHLQTFSPLLRLLSPRQVGDVWVLENPIRLTRFNEIAACVHSIEWSETGWAQGLLENFAQMARLLHAVQPHDLLPNLRWFHAYCETRHGVRTIVPWLSGSLTTVDIILGLAADDSAATDFLSALEGHSTHITSLSLRMDSSPPRRQFMGQLPAVLQGLRAVRSVTIPLYASRRLRRQHLVVLGAAPHLEELDLFLLESPVGVAGSMLFGGAQGDIVEDDSVDHDLSHIHGLPLQLSQPAFHSLHTLCITGSLTDIADIVQDTTQHLKQLHLTVPSIRDANEMSRAMRDIATFCPHLVFVTIDIWSPDHPEWMDLNPLDQRPLEIHTQHPRLHPHFLVWRRGEDGVLERGFGIVQP